MTIPGTEQPKQHQGTAMSESELTHSEGCYIAIAIIDGWSELS
ncbi:Uncharacterised protein [Yersinia intermedia]|nr:Uncharacterised protein [Yersinia intermedia]